VIKDESQRPPTGVGENFGTCAVGLDYLRSVIVDDSLGICAELDAAMARHVEDYADEWAAVLDDPERLRRFVSFVNAQDTPDPSIEFVEQRGQRKPLLTIGGSR